MDQVHLLQAMVQEGKVWSIHNAEKKDDVLYPKDAKPLIFVSQDLVDCWHSIKVNALSMTLMHGADCPVAFA